MVVSEREIYSLRGLSLSGILEVGICKVLKRRYLFVLFCFVFLPELPRAADQNVCKQSWAAQAELCYRKCLFPAKTEITASRPFNSLLGLSTRSLIRPSFHHWSNVRKDEDRKLVVDPAKK